jgi:hypothetical protein
MNEGDHSGAGFWFYAGQLRLRVLRAVTNDPALGQMQGAFQAGIGDPINEVYFKKPLEWLATIDKVLEWDLKTPNTLTPYDRNQVVYDDIRAGLVEFKSIIREKYLKPTK